eukprot:SAG31_NODE_404_length_16109_cov_10.686696_10_plen_126_part_00
MNLWKTHSRTNRQIEYDLAFEVSYQAHKLNGETKTQFQARVTASMDNLRIPRHGDPDAQQEPPPRGLHDVFFVVAGEDALIDWPEFSASFVAKMPAGQKKWNSEQVGQMNSDCYFYDEAQPLFTV